MPPADRRRAELAHWALPWLALCALPALLQWPGWSGWLSQNPVYSFFSGLSPGGRPLLDGAPFVDGNAGVTMQALGRAAVRSWLAGRVPWWNHDSGIGLPLAAEMQPGAFFLPFILLLGLWGGLLWLKVAMQAIAGVATYGLLRALGLGRWAGLLASALFELNGTFALFSDAPIMTLPFLPALLLAVERCSVRARAGMRGGSGLVALTLGFSLVAGFPELAYLDGLLAGAWSLLRLAQAGPARRRLAGKLAGGAALGVAVTLPATLPFVQYLQAAGIGTRSASGLGLQAPHWAMLLLPALFGPPFWGRHYALWDTFVGGSCDTGLLLLALLGAAWRGAPEPGLRVLLAAWIAVTALRLGDVPVISALLNQLPFMRLVHFFRYGQPGLEMAACILCGFALDRWRLGRLPRRLPPPLALLVAVLVAAALAAARPTLGSFAGQPLERWFLAGSMLWALLLLGLLALLLTRAPGRVARGGLAALLLLDAGAMFSLPMLAGARDRRLDLGGVALLRGEAGLARIFTMGPLTPNYPSFFDIASIDYNSVLVPRDWVDYVRAHLDPAADPANLDGLAAPDGPSRLRAREAALAGLGVGFVVTPAGQEWRPLGAPPGPLRAVPLEPGHALSFTLPETGLPTGRLEALRLSFGLYDRPGRGDVSARLCQADGCATTVLRLDGAADSAPHDATLQPALALQPGRPLTLHLAREAGAPPVALWLAGGAPVMALRPQGELPVSYRGPVMRIARLPQAAAYAEAPGCRVRVTAGDRDRIEADCAQPARLIRRELFAPGWRVLVDGQPRTLSRAGEIFQSVRLPAGRSRVLFGYRPPGSRSAAAVAAAALLIRAASGIRRRPRR